MNPEHREWENRNQILKYILQTGPEVEVLIILI